VNRVFSSERVKGLEASIRSLADLLADRIQKMPGWDLMADLAQPLPTMLIAEILGIPGDRHQQFKSWANAVVTGASGMGAQSRAGEDIQDIDLFLREIIESRQVRPGDDLISQLMAETGEDDVLTPSQVLSFSKLLIVAGSETTTNLIGNAVLALLRNPTEFDKLKDNPAMLAGAIEETLRYDSPVQFVMRKTTQGATLLGHDLPAGAHVIALIGSANRDESRFADAEVFDIGRKPQANLAFGLGPHYCLGPVLARMEAQIVFERFWPIISKCRAAGDLSNIPLVQSIQVRGPRALPLIRSDL
jgi:cytochrome P450